MCYVRFERMTSKGEDALYNLYFDNVLAKTSLTLDEVMQEISKKEETEK